MLKNIVLFKCILSALLLFTVTDGKCQQSGNLTLRLDGGIGIPLISQTSFGDSEYWNQGVNGGIGAGYRFTNSLQIRTYFNYQSFRLNAESTAARYSSSGNVVYSGAEKILQLSGEVQWMLKPQKRFASPYLTAGAGAFRSTTKDLYISDSENYVVDDSWSEWAPGLTTAAGLNFLLHPDLHVFIEARFNALFPEGGSGMLYLPLTAGIVF